MTPTAASLHSAFAPSGTLRASINLGNPLLANRSADGQAFGVSIDLSRELARTLDLPLELLLFNKAQQSVEAVESGVADIGFFAIDPKRGQHIAFTAPYVDIEGSYLVRIDSPLESNEQVDRPGHRVVTVADSAYDLHLSRTLRHAQIVRAPNADQLVERFLAQDFEVLASLRLILQTAAAQVPGVRLLPGAFMVIHQAMGIAKSRDVQALEYLCAFIEQMKASGFVADAISRHGIEGATVAPAARSPG